MVHTISGTPHELFSASCFTPVSRSPKIMHYTSERDLQVSTSQGMLTCTSHQKQFIETRDDDDDDISALAFVLIQKMMYMYIDT